MYVQCFDCGTEIEMTIRISDLSDPEVVICPICKSEDIEVDKE